MNNSVAIALSSILLAGFLSFVFSFSFLATVVILILMLVWSYCEAYTSVEFLLYSVYSTLASSLIVGFAELVMIIVG